MNRTDDSNHAPAYVACTIDNPDDFYIWARLKDDKECLNYFNNLLSRYDWWVNTKKFPTSRGATTCMWRCDVMKRICNERGITVPDMYDTLMGYEPPVKKRKQTIDGLQEEVRAAEQALKAAKARARAAVATLAHADANDTVPLRSSSNSLDQSEDTVQFEVDDVVDTSSNH